MMGSACNTNGDRRNAYRLLVRKSDGKRAVGRSRYKYVDNIKMDLKDIGWGFTDLICLAQDRGNWRAVLNTVMNIQVPINAGKLLRSCTRENLSRRAQVHGVS
jgi:hypothetical protein